jgi:hypothetical protein
VAPVDAALMLDPATGIPHGAGFPDDVRLMTPLFNVGGALALLFGAAHSAWVYWRRRANAERVVSNSLIALGAFAPSLTSSLNRFGITGVFYLGELLGVLLIFAGFLASSDVIAGRLHRSTGSGARPGLGARGSGDDHGSAGGPRGPRADHRLTDPGLAPPPAAQRPKLPFTRPRR